MTRDFLIGARRPHEGEMLRLGLGQLEESEKRLRELLVAYQETKTPSLAKQIAEECVFASMTLNCLTDLADHQSSTDEFIVSARMLVMSRDLRRLIESAESIIGSRERNHDDVA